MIKYLCSVKETIEKWTEENQEKILKIFIIAYKRLIIMTYIFFLLLLINKQKFKGAKYINGHFQKEELEWLICFWKRCLVFLLFRDVTVKMRDTTPRRLVKKLETQVMASYQRGCVKTGIGSGGGGWGGLWYGKVLEATYPPAGRGTEK